MKIMQLKNTKFEINALFYTLIKLQTKVRVIPGSVGRSTQARWSLYPLIQSSPRTQDTKGPSLTFRHLHRQELPVSLHSSEQHQSSPTFGMLSSSSPIQAAWNHRPRWYDPLLHLIRGLSTSAKKMNRWNLWVKPLVSQIAMGNQVIANQNNLFIKNFSVRTQTPFDPTHFSLCWYQTIVYFISDQLIIT